MPPLPLRLLKTALPCAAVLALGGYCLAEGFGQQIATEKDPALELTGQMKWKIPLALALWGGGAVAIFEALRHVWMTKPTAPTEVKITPEQEAEILLRQLLDRVEADERNNRADVGETTPPPRGATVEVPNGATAHVQ